MEKPKTFIATPRFAALAEALLRGKEAGHRPCTVRSLAAAHVSRKTLAKV